MMKLAFLLFVVVFVAAEPPFLRVAIDKVRRNDVSTRSSDGLFTVITKVVWCTKETGVASCSEPAVIRKSIDPLHEASMHFYEDDGAVFVRNYAHNKQWPARVEITFRRVDVFGKTRSTHFVGRNFAGSTPELPPSPAPAPAPAPEPEAEPEPEPEIHEIQEEHKGHESAARPWYYYTLAGMFCVAAVPAMAFAGLKMVQRYRTTQSEHGARGAYVFHDMKTGVDEDMELAAKVGMFNGPRENWDRNKI
jgi:hypothetical protein